MAFLKDTFGPEYGEPIPDPISGREDFLLLSAMAAGWNRIGGALLATSTNGRTMRLHNMTANTRSPRIIRHGLLTERDVVVCFNAHMDAMPFWEQESDDWGADPYSKGE